MVEVNITDDFVGWWDTLTEDEQEDVTVAVELLEREGLAHRQGGGEEDMAVRRWSEFKKERLSQERAERVARRVEKLRTRPSPRHPHRLVYTSSMRKQLIVELDEPLARELERVAPARSRRRSSFVRAALRRALAELVEERMAEAYKAQPDVEPAHFDPRLWEPRAAAMRASGRRRR